MKKITFLSMLALSSMIYAQENDVKNKDNGNFNYIGAGVNTSISNQDGNHVPVNLKGTHRDASGYQNVELYHNLAEHGGGIKLEALMADRNSNHSDPYGGVIEGEFYLKDNQMKIRVGGGMYSNIFKDDLLSLVYSVEGDNQDDNVCTRHLFRVRNNVKVDSNILVKFSIGAQKLFCNYIYNAGTDHETTKSYEQKITPNLSLEISNLLFDKRLLVEAGFTYDGGTRSAKSEDLKFDTGNAKASIGFGYNFGLGSKSR